MKYYFQLQVKMIARQIKAFGISPVLLGLVGVLVFIILSLQLFATVQYAAYVYVFLAVGCLIRLSNTLRNTFLKTVFTPFSFLLLRMVENTIVVFPFLIFLSFKNEFIVVLGLFIAANAIVFLQFKNNKSVYLPTPFYKHPFEFIIGFRQYFLIIAALYAIAVVSVLVNNFNLGMAALGLLIIVCMSFYTAAERLFYVWVFSSTPKGFLKSKIKTAILFTLLLCIIPAGCLIIFNVHNWYIVIAVLLAGVLFVVTIVFAKYSVYPATINLPQAIIIALCFSFPPLIILVLPFFYFQSLQKLKLYLV